MPILAYHKIDTRFELGITATLPHVFKQQMHCLKNEEINVGSLEHVLTDPTHCSITFDDAYESVYDQAMPVLDAAEFKATIFPVTGFIGKDNGWDVNFFWQKFKHMNAQQLCTISDAGHTLGSHTVSHRDLTLLNDTELTYELEYSKKHIEDLVGKKVTLLSYPFGKTDNRVIAAARAAGYTHGISMRGAADDLFRIGRRAVYRFDRMATFKRKISQQGYTIDDRKGAFINWCAQGTPLWRQRSRLS